MFAELRGQAYTLLFTAFCVCIWIIAAPIMYLNDWWEGLFDKKTRRKRKIKRECWELENPREERMMVFYEYEEENDRDSQ